MTKIYPNPEKVKAAETLPMPLRASLSAPSLEVMNFLNEVVMRFPQAISFAPGRPAESLFDVEASLRCIGTFADHQAATQNLSRQRVFETMGQYGTTNGLIQDLIVRHLEVDEGIHVAADSIIVTVGCQEGMLILMMGLFDPALDVLLVSDPTYIGITGLAQILGVEVRPIATGATGLDPEAVAAAIIEVEKSGKRAKAVYDVPDFNNPLGTSMPLAARHRLLEVARQHGVLIFEDNPYGMFSYDGDPPPTLKSLDRQDNPMVVYLGSFSKTLFPGLRLGYLVADQSLPGADGEDRPMATDLSKVKSLTTVNSSPLTQALAGGILVENGGSLRRVVAKKLPFYKRNHDTMLAALERSFRALGLADQVQWNRPGGGFFLTVDLPFEFDETCLEECASEYRVIVCPLPFFALAPGYERRIRLSFSYVEPEQIEQGVERLARFVADRIQR
jgi:(S)-3,5-dihydroxyphenylglycine transaminase